jgi:hypothetical protein
MIPVHPKYKGAFGNMVWHTAHVDVQAHGIVVALSASLR